MQKDTISNLNSIAYCLLPTAYCLNSRVASKHGQTKWPSFVWKEEDCFISGGYEGALAMTELFVKKWKIASLSKPTKANWEGGCYSDLHFEALTKEGIFLTDTVRERSQWYISK